MRVDNITNAMNTNIRNSIMYNMESKSPLVFRSNKLERDKVDLSLSARSQGMKIAAPIKKTRTAGLIITDFKVSKPTKEGPSISYEKSKATVSNERAALGTSENRLGGNTRTIDNSNNKNIESENSRLRDIEKAKERMKMVKEDLFDDLPRSILAQGNSTDNTVLHLLR